MRKIFDVASDDIRRNPSGHGLFCRLTAKYFSNNETTLLSKSFLLSNKIKLMAKFLSECRHGLIGDHRFGEGKIGSDLAAYIAKSYGFPSELGKKSRQGRSEGRS